MIKKFIKDKKLNNKKNIPNQTHCLFNCSNWVFGEKKTKWHFIIYLNNLREEKERKIKKKEIKLLNSHFLKTIF